MNVVLNTDSDQVLSTCRSDGRLLSPGKGLTVTPLQVFGFGWNLGNLFSQW